LIRALGEDGKLVNGVAVDANPLLLLAPRVVTAGTGYAGGTPDSPDESDLNWTNYPKRLFTRTTLSLATTGADATGSSRSAFGLRVGIIDQADPGLFYARTVKCLKETPAPALPPGRTSGSKPPPPGLEECLQGQRRDLETKRPLWARFSLYAGYGQSWYSQTSALTDQAPDVKTFWLTSSYGLLAPASIKEEEAQDSMRWLVQGYLERKINNRVTDPDDANALIRRDSTQAILRLKGGDGNKHMFLEAGKTRAKLASSVTENVTHAAFGAEFNLGKLFGSTGTSGMETWVQLASVQERGFADGNKKSGVTLNFKFGAPFLDLPGSAKQ
jgi:hypothetical protein